VSIPGHLVAAARWAAASTETASARSTSSASESTISTDSLRGKAVLGSEDGRSTASLPKCQRIMWLKAPLALDEELSEPLGLGHPASGFAT
jgi:hypothetical protein